MCLILHHTEPSCRLITLRSSSLQKTSSFAALVFPKYWGNVSAP
uniref:Uncharacterized protein n=1 Tax=Arundo donax TaxID=35708 RepID=A0A0A9C439_ARUDO